MKFWWLIKCKKIYRLSSFLFSFLLHSFLLHPLFVPRRSSVGSASVVIVFVGWAKGPTVVVDPERRAGDIKFETGDNRFSSAKRRFSCVFFSFFFFVHFSLLPVSFLSSIKRISFHFWRMVKTFNINFDDCDNSFKETSNFSSFEFFFFSLLVNSKP